MNAPNNTQDAMAAFSPATGSAARAYSIYVLLESEKHVRYIGITNQKPERRMLQHYADASRKRTDHKTNWIRRCLAEGIQIELRVVRTGLSQLKAQKMEIRLLRFFGKAFNLVNSHSGGASGYSGLSADSKAKHSASGKARFKNPAEKARTLRHAAAMRAAKERKRLANPVEPETKLVRWFPLELGLRDKRTGETAWVDFRSVRDAARRLLIVQKYYQ